MIRRNDLSIVVYASCWYRSHIQSFCCHLFYEGSHTFNVFVYATKCENSEHRGKRVYASLKRTERIEVGELLESMPPQRLRRKMIKHMDPDLAN